MLEGLEKSTIALKLKLIELGYALPPASVMHKNKLRQIDMDYKQMANILLGSSQPTLFQNATAVILATTARYYNIQDLQQLARLTAQTCLYVSNY